MLLLSLSSYDAVIEHIITDITKRSSTTTCTSELTQGTTLTTVVTMSSFADKRSSSSVHIQMHWTVQLIFNITDVSQADIYSLIDVKHTEVRVDRCSESRNLETPYGCLARHRYMLIVMLQNTCQKYKKCCKTAV